jgi:hypothetical protein
MVSYMPRPFYPRGKSTRYPTGTRTHTLRTSRPQLVVIPIKICKKKMIRGIFGPKREEVTGDWRKLHNEELH